MNPPVADVGNISGIFLENCYMERGNGKFKEHYIKKNVIPFDVYQFTFYVSAISMSTQDKKIKEIMPLIKQINYCLIR